MPNAYDPYREPKDIGSESPASEEAKEQGMSGDRGAEQEQQSGTPEQPAQTSGRRSAQHEQEPAARKSFSPEERPSEQGEGEPSPERLKERSSMQGIGARSGSHGAHGHTAEEEAQKGPPSAGHARHGRQNVPGQPERPDDDAQMPA